MRAAFHVALFGILNAANTVAADIPVLHKALWLLIPLTLIESAYLFHLIFKDLK